MSSYLDLHVKVETLTPSCASQGTFRSHSSLIITTFGVIRQILGEESWDVTPKYP